MIVTTLLSYFIVFFTCLLLSILLCFSGRKYTHLLLFNIILCLWSFFNISFIIAPSSDQALRYAKLMGITMVGIPFLFLNTAISLSYYKIEKQKRYKIINNSIALFLSILMISPYVFVGVGPLMDFKYVPIASPIFLFFLLYMAMLIIAGHIVLYRSIKYNYKNKYIFYGYIVGWVGGLTTLPQFLGIPIYPFLVSLIALYTPFVTYSLVSHRMLDKISTFSILITKLVSLGVLVISYQLFFKVYNMIGFQNAYFENILNLFFFLASIELYRFMIKRMELARSSSKNINIYDSNKILDNIKQHILDVVTIEELWHHLQDIIEKQIGVKVLSFYISKDLGAIEIPSKKQDFLRYHGEEIPEKYLKVIEDQISKNNINLSIKYNEVNYFFQNILKEIGCYGIIPILYNKNKVGFITLAARPNISGFFYYQDLALFDDLADKSGYALERVRLHLQFLKEREKALKSLAGSIAHEIRNPISSIRSSVGSLSINEKHNNLESLKNLTRQQLEQIIINDTNEIIEHKSHLEKSINLANSIIDMTLSDLSGKSISHEDLIFLDSNLILIEAVDFYSFKSNEKRKRILINLGENEPSFIFRGVKTAFYYIIFNLLKNALYYVNSNPDLKIKITKSFDSGANIIKKIRQIDNQYNIHLDSNLNYNVFHIEDNGPGISPEILKKLFGNFVTSGKSKGTGLGLAFCKRTMIDFGGDINCESELGSWTRFNLYFPELSEEEKAQAKSQINQISKKSEIKNITNNSLEDLRNVAIIGDYDKIENEIKDTLPDVKICKFDNNESFFESINDSNNSLIYDLVIIEDLKSQIVEKIKSYNKKTIIFALVEESKNLESNIKNLIENEVDEIILKPISASKLINKINKWFNKRTYDSYDISQIKEQLKGLKILIVDDEEINVMMMKRYLKKYDIEVESANDGAELIKKYQDQFIESKFNNKYDIIIADISMPVMNGNEAVKEIRNFELNNKIDKQAIIIANSGDGESEKIKIMLKSGFDDYFIKGEDNLKLLKIIYFWLKTIK